MRQTTAVIVVFLLLFIFCPSFATAQHQPNEELGVGVIDIPDLLVITQIRPQGLQGVRSTFVWSDEFFAPTIIDDMRPVRVLPDVVAIEIVARWVGDIRSDEQLLYLEFDQGYASYVDDYLLSEQDGLIICVRDILHDTVLHHLYLPKAERMETTATTVLEDVLGQAPAHYYVSTIDASSVTVEVYFDNHEEWLRHNKLFIDAAVQVTHLCQEQELCFASMTLAFRPPFRGRGSVLRSDSFTVHLSAWEDSRNPYRVLLEMLVHEFGHVVFSKLSPEEVLLYYRNSVVQARAYHVLQHYTDGRFTLIKSAGHPFSGTNETYASVFRANSMNWNELNLIGSRIDQLQRHRAFFAISDATSTLDLSSLGFFYDNQ